MFSELKELDVFGWLYGLLDAAITGACVAFLALPLSTIIGSLTFTPRQYATVAMAGAITAAAKFLKDHALPSKRTIATALAMPPGSTPQQLSEVLKKTNPGVVPTPQEAASIVKNG